MEDLFESDKTPGEQLGMTDDQLKAILVELSEVAQIEFDTLSKTVQDLKEEDLENVGIRLVNWAIKKGKTPKEWAFFGAKAAVAANLVTENLQKALVNAIMQDMTDTLNEARELKQVLKEKSIGPTKPGPAKGD